MATDIFHLIYCTLLLHLNAVLRFFAASRYKIGCIFKYFLNYYFKLNNEETQKINSVDKQKTFLAFKL